MELQKPFKTGFKLALGFMVANVVLVLVGGVLAFSALAVLGFSATSLFLN